MVAITDFDKILLFHESENMKYIRKLTMSYAYHTCMGLVDRNDNVTHLGLSNTFQIIPFKELTVNDKRLLGKKKCSLLKDNDLMSVYRIDSAVKLNPKYKLVKKCRSMRYSTTEETYYLKYLLLSTLKDKANMNIIESDKDYTNSLYSEKISLSGELDLSFNEDFKPQSDSRIYNEYQTTLI